MKVSLQKTPKLIQEDIRKERELKPDRDEGAQEADEVKAEDECGKESERYQSVEEIPHAIATKGKHHCSGVSA